MSVVIGSRSYLPTYLLPTLVFQDGVIEDKLLEMQMVLKLVPKMTYLFFKALLCNVSVLIVATEEGVRTASGLSFLGLSNELWVEVPFLMTSWSHVALSAICLGICAGEND